MKKPEQPDALKNAIANLQKKYGDGVVIQAGEGQEKVETLPTGSFILDYIMGDGLPVGRVIDVFGQESSGKSTLCMFIAGHVQKNGGTVAFIDAEHAYDIKYATTLGINTEKLLVSQPSTLEETFDIIRAYAETNAVNLIIVDSVAALTPKAELEGDEMLKDSIAIQARLMSKALRIITGPVAKSKMTVIFISQLRTNIGVMWGDKMVASGGKALKFYSSVRLSVAKGEKIKGKNDEQIGNVLKITAVKNKVAPPFRSGEITLYYGSGIDMAKDTFDAAVQHEVITKSGNTYSYGDVRLGVGVEQGTETLKKATELYAKIRAIITEKIKG